MTFPALTEVTDGVCGSWTGQKGRGGATSGWERDGSRDEHNTGVDFGNSQGRAGKILVGRTHPEVGKEQPQSSEGRERSLGASGCSEGTRAWVSRSHFPAKVLFIPSALTCLWMSSLEATSCSPTLPPRPGLHQGSIYGEKRKETEANYFTNCLITLSTPSPPRLHSGAAAAAAPTSSLSWHISSHQSSSPTSQGQKSLINLWFRKLRAIPAPRKLQDRGLLRRWSQYLWSPNGK